jgi:hypothetical protein
MPPPIRDFRLENSLLNPLIRNKFSIPGLSHVSPITITSKFTFTIDRNKLKLAILESLLILLAYNPEYCSNIDLYVKLKFEKEE